jgi:2-dehydropantoate 2-reductase
MTKKTILLSLQNGLDNINKISKFVDRTQILAGVTTHGILFSSPGVITHTGTGTTVIGELDGQQTTRGKEVVSLFCEAGIPTTLSDDIIRQIWIKTIINSSINPLTAFFQCRNGYLLKNPVLRGMVENICRESVRIAQENKIKVSEGDMIQQTRKVIVSTQENYSSMVQSIQLGKHTEIDAINGALVRKGKEQQKDVSLNQLMVSLISSNS